jgi:hypothetical protein
MGTFTFVSYSGPDAGIVLVKMLADGVPEAEVHDLESVEEERRPIGFQPNPESDDEEPEEGDDDEGDD